MVGEGRSAARRQARSAVLFAASEVDARGGVAVLGGDQVLRELGAGWGDTSFKLDGDGIYRRLFYSLQGGLKSFAIAVASRAENRPITKSSFPHRSVPVDFAGPPGTITTASFSHVLPGEVPRAVLRGFPLHDSP